MSTEEEFWKIMARETARINGRMGQYALYQQQIMGGDNGARISSKP